MTTTIGDLFPAFPRVFYRKAPLVQVTCQLRFPALLTIEKAPPAEFQERIRRAFPGLERPANLALPAQLPAQVAEAIRAQAGTAGWRFLTEDKRSTVALSPDSLILTTTNYDSWGKFQDQWRPVFSALMDIYAPSYFEPASLRYQDIIIRENIGLDPTTPWSDLLRAEILGEASIRQIEQHVVDASRVLRMNLPDGSMLVLQHGLAKQAGGDQVGYLIDLDFGTRGKVEVTDAESALTKLHQNVWCVFRWCIRDKLHRTLEPIDPPSDGG